MSMETIRHLRALETTWRRCAKGWFALHWFLLTSNLAAAALMIVGLKLTDLGVVLDIASLYVPISTIAIATVRPSTRVTTFVVAYRILYFALLRQGEGLLTMDQLIAEAERAESLISKGGYAPNMNDLQLGGDTPGDRFSRTRHRAARDKKGTE